MIALATQRVVGRRFGQFAALIDRTALATTCAVGVSFQDERCVLPLSWHDVASLASNQAPRILRDPSSSYANIAAVSGLPSGDGEEGDVNRA